METLNFNNVEVDRCTACYGLFFDHLEKEMLKEMAGSEVLDIGDEFLGATYNEILDAPCPRCRTRMNHVLHTEPFEIKFEAVPIARAPTLMPVNSRTTWKTRFTISSRMSSTICVRNN